jgi:glycine dehydrogenase subunit 1
MTFTPHTKQNIDEMLKAIGIENTQELFDEIPKNIPRATLESLADGMNEMMLLAHAEDIAKNLPNMTCFLGAGCYDHHIPSAVWDIATRGEFLTSYTPYQAEVSQGTLQVLYEFQTMIAELYELDVANASLYDGATALAEAILMAKRIQKNHSGHQVLIPKALHPHYKDVLSTILKHQHIEIIEAPFDNMKGITDVHALTENPDVFASVISQINFFGQCEPIDELVDFAKSQEQICIGQANPMFLSVFKGPGQWGKSGVDIACGEGQPLGIPMASGGPFLGLLTCKKEYVRQMPGRIIGRTTDIHGKDGFVLTLQAREQHIRRGKATSNICTNVGLNVTAATIYMSLMGAEGLRKSALHGIENTHKLARELLNLDGVQLFFSNDFINEAVIRFPMPVATIIDDLAHLHLLAGLDLGAYFHDMQNALLICATEKRTDAEIKQYVEAIKECLQRHMVKSEGVAHVTI